MTKVLITRDANGSGDTVCIWPTNATKKDLFCSENGVWDAPSEATFGNVIAICPGSFKEVFGWVPKSGTAQYYVIRKLRKNRTVAKRVIYYHEKCQQAIHKMAQLLNEGMASV